MRYKLEYYKDTELTHYPMVIISSELSHFMLYGISHQDFHKYSKLKPPVINNEKLTFPKKPEIKYEKVSYTSSVRLS